MTRAGKTPKKPDGVGCTFCTCSPAGQWNCSNTGCQTDAGPPACVEGESRPAGDGCNTCSCDASGEWACTERFCSLPDAGTPCGGFAGNTCAAGQYCAYTEGELCGAADAEASCAPKPMACSKEFQQVCGCDGNTYDNACLAAMAGTGVMYSHGCENPCAGSSPTGNGMVIQGCPCGVPVGNEYCCPSEKGSDFVCYDGSRGQVFDGHCDAYFDGGAQSAFFAGTVQCQ